MHGKIAKYELARRKGIEAILERQPLWIFEKLRDEMPAYWAAHGQPIVHLERGAYDDVPRALGVRRDRRRARAVPGRARSVRGRHRRAAARPRGRAAARLPRLLRAAPRGEPRLSALPPAVAARALPARGARLVRLARRAAADPASAAACSRRRATAVVLALSVGPSLVAWVSDPWPPPWFASSRGDVARHDRRSRVGRAMKPSRAIPLALLLALVVRLPFWIEALRTPVDGDTAIVGLMARHPGVGTTMWGQPYGSPLDSWLALPFVAVWGYSTEALRLPVLPARARARAPRLRAWRASCTPRPACPRRCSSPVRRPYFLLLAALPPPFYPTTLLLCGLVLWLSARAVRAVEAEIPTHAPRGTLLLAGLFSGLALWTHLMSASTVAAAAAWLLRPTPRTAAPARVGARAAASRPARRSGRACCATPRRRASCRSRTGRSRRPSTWPPCCRGCTSRSAVSWAPTCR